MEDFNVVIPKSEAAKCIDFSNEAEPRFLIKKDLATKEGSEAYSDVLEKYILEKFNTNLAVGNGKIVGKFFVTVYMECSHGAKFHAKIARKKFIPDADLQFTLTRSKNRSDCNCGNDIFLSMFD